MRHDARAVVFNAWAKAIKPPPVLSVAQWADAHRILSAKGSSEPGPWRTDRVPYLREIMDNLSDRSPVRRIVVKKSTQVGLTEVGLNWIGYSIHRRAGALLVYVPTRELRKRWVVQRLDPMIADTDVINEIASHRKRDTANSEDVKVFPGCLVFLNGANSTNAARSSSAGLILLDEIDSFPWDLGGEGDPIGLIERRASNFPRRKLLLISSPTNAEASRIDDEYEASDQRRYLVPCPDCDHYQPLVWSNLQWDDSLSRVVYVCAECGVEIEEHHKPAMLAAGRWVAQRPQRATRGYHINGLYAPLGLGYSWRELVRDWKAAQGDVSKLKRFINTALGEVWRDERARDLTAEALAERGEPYALRTVPPGCLVLTAGVDTQDDRLAIQVLGWGAGGVCWVIDWVEIPGHPGRPELWAALTEYLNTPLNNAYGEQLAIESTAIDSGGHFTQEVYRYVRERLVRRPMAIKGASQRGKPILTRGNYVDFNWRGRTIPNALRVWLVGTDTAKHGLFNRLSADEDRPPEERSLHFSEGLSLDYFRQLTGEVFNPEKNKWVLKRGRRVEALDTFVYATVAAQHPKIRVHTKPESAWRALADRLEPGTRQADAPAPAAKAPAKPKRARLPRRVGS